MSEMSCLAIQVFMSSRMPYLLMSGPLRSLERPSYSGSPDTMAVGTHFAIMSKVARVTKTAHT